MRSILSDCRVGIAGAGGLGSNCAISLARAGVGHLVIADFDTVSESNLDRQYYFRRQVGMKKVLALAETIALVDPAIEILAHDAVLDERSIPALFAGCDVIVEALDQADQKKLLIEMVLARLPDARIVAASGLAGTGKVGELKTVRMDRLVLCGDFEREVSAEDPPVAPRVAIVANMEADVVLEILLHGG